MDHAQRHATAQALADLSFLLELHMTDVLDGMAPTAPIDTPLRDRLTTARATADRLSTALTAILGRLPVPGP